MYANKLLLLFSIIACKYGCHYIQGLNSPAFQSPIKHTADIHRLWTFYTLWTSACLLFTHLMYQDLFQVYVSSFDHFVCLGFDSDFTHWWPDFCLFLNRSLCQVLDYLPAFPVAGVVFATWPLRSKTCLNRKENCKSLLHFLTDFTKALTVVSSF